MNDSYTDKLLKSAKDTTKLGIVTTVGGGVVGAIGGGIPGAAPAVGAVNASMGLLNVGNVANIGMNVLPSMFDESNNKSKKKQTNPNPFK